MQTRAEVEVLASLAAGAACVVNAGVYEGSSALVFCEALDAHAQLHLIDPYVEDEYEWSLRRGDRASRFVARLVTARAARRAGPEIHWHIARSQDVGRGWRGPHVDLLFVDGDHRTESVREDWEVWRPWISARGVVAFHDARLGVEQGIGHPGPTALVSELFRGPSRVEGWRIQCEVDGLVAVGRCEREEVSAPRRPAP
jgi:hypothetical protein